MGACTLTLARVFAFLELLGMFKHCTKLCLLGDDRRMWQGRENCLATMDLKKQLQHIMQIYWYLPTPGASWDSTIFHGLQVAVSSLC